MRCANEKNTINSDPGRHIPNLDLTVPSMVYRDCGCAEFCNGVEQYTVVKGKPPGDPHKTLQ